MLKILKVFMTLLAVTFYANVFAADQAYVDSQVKSFMQDLQAKTTLTAEQQTQMQKILTDSITKRENAIAKYQGQSGMSVKMSIRNDLEAINASTQTEVQQVLNEQQYQSFLAVQDVHKEQVKKRINNEF